MITTRKNRAVDDDFLIAQINMPVRFSNLEERVAKLEKTLADLSDEELFQEGDTPTHTSGSTTVPFEDTSYYDKYKSDKPVEFTWVCGDETLTIKLKEAEGDWYWEPLGDTP